MNFLPLAILFFGGLILTVGDIVFKTWVEKGALYSFSYGIGILLYLIGSMLLVESYKYDVNIVAAGIIQVLFNTLILVAFTYFYFHEPLTPTQIIGIALGVVAIYLIQ